MQTTRDCRHVPKIPPTPYLTSYCLHAYNGYISQTVEHRERNTMTTSLETMTTVAPTAYADYLDSLDVAKRFVKEATVRVTDYVNAGLANVPTGTLIGPSYAGGGKRTAATHRVTFNMAIAADSEGNVMVHLDSYSSYDDFVIRVPLGVVTG